MPATRASPAAVSAAAAATVVAPANSVGAPPSVAARASGTGLLAVDGAVATASLRGTFAGVALQATLGVKTRIDAKKIKESHEFFVRSLRSNE